MTTSPAVPPEQERRRSEPGAATSGPVLFARYAYPPNALGYCGPADPAGLLGMAAEGADGRGLAALAARFEGAWPYLELIAACNGIDDPLDSRVVDAYWVGNRLLEAVPAPVLVSSLRQRFGSRLSSGLESLSAVAARRARAHHSLHVFGVYPWVGMLRGGMEGAPLVVLDRCRIRWGTVLSIQGDELVARSRPLTVSGWRLVLGDERVEVVRRSLDGTGMVAELAPGDTVSMHWDWVCDRLDERALRRLRHYTARTLDAVNLLPAPAPALG